jgi:hypothetical protein
MAVDEVIIKFKGRKAVKLLIIEGYTALMGYIDLSEQPQH